MSGEMSSAQHLCAAELEESCPYGLDTFCPLADVQDNTSMESGDVHFDYEIHNMDITTPCGTDNIDYTTELDNGQQVYNMNDAMNSYYRQRQLGQLATVNRQLGQLATVNGNNNNVRRKLSIQKNPKNFL